MEALATGNQDFVLHSDLENLEEDFRAAWVPDVAAGVDYPAYLAGAPAGDGPVFQPLRVPKPNGGHMSIRVLHPGWHAALHRVAVGLRGKIDETLGPGVFGYRRGADRSYNYSDEWLAFSSHTASEAQRAEWVVLADVSAFFSSISWLGVAESLAEIDVNLTKPLLDLAFEFERAGLDHPPSGYADARLLCNAVLDAVDRRLEVPIARWVDDYRLFIPPGMDPEGQIGALRQALDEVGLQLNEAKTEIVPGARGAEASKSALSSVYHPDRDAPEKVQKNLHRLFYESLDNPQAHRRSIRFLLPRLAKESDDIALSFAFDGLRTIPWEAPRLVKYLSAFEGRPEVAYLIDSNLAAAAARGDAWVTARLGVLGCHLKISSRTAAVLVENIGAFEGTPAWGMLLRVLALSGREEAAVIAEAEDPPDPRAAITALRDLDRPIPPHLAEAEPVLAEVLKHWSAPPPSADTIL
jgi:Reverse transcriptase (RNA-dependent DNA polymerase)